MSALIQRQSFFVLTFIKTRTKQTSVRSTTYRQLTPVTARLAAVRATLTVSETRRAKRVKPVLVVTLAQPVASAQLELAARVF